MLIYVGHHAKLTRNATKSVRNHFAIFLEFDETPDEHAEFSKDDKVDKYKIGKNNLI